MGGCNTKICLRFGCGAEKWVQCDELLVNKRGAIRKVETGAVCPNKIVVERPFFVENTTDSHNLGTGSRVEPLRILERNEIAGRGWSTSRNHTSVDQRMPHPQALLQKLVAY